MTSHGKSRFRRLFLGVLAATLLVPASAAAAGYPNVVQIGGDFAALSQVSAWQASADSAPSSRLVQIGGVLVEPSQLSAWQSHAADRVDSSTALVAQNSGFDWSDAGFAAAVGIGALLLIGGCLEALRNERLQPPLAGAHP